MTQTIIGVDPGISGAIAVLDWHSGESLAVYDMPTVRIGKGNEIQVPELHVILGGHAAGCCMCIVETQGAMPKNGVVASFRLGQNFGALKAVLDIVGIPWKEVRPAVWKKTMGVTKDKNSSLVLARRQWPNAELTRKKDDGRAEALLIAEYGRGRMGA